MCEYVYIWHFNFYRCKSSEEVSKEKWLRPVKYNSQNVDENCKSSVFCDMLIDKCWPDRQLPLMKLNVDLNVISSDDDVELNLYPILRILENQRIYNQNENIVEFEKQEVITYKICIYIYI